MVRIAEITFRILFIVMFVYSGWSKLSDPVEFQRTLYKYRLFSDSLVPFLTFYVPLLELTLSLALTLPPTFKAALKCNLLMLLSFTAVLATLVYRGIDADCGCLGSLGSTPKTAIVRNIFLLAAAAFLVWRSVRQDQSADPAFTPE